MERERRIKEDLKPEDMEKIAESMEEKTETRNPLRPAAAGLRRGKTRNKNRKREGKTEGLGVESRPVGPKLDLKTHKLEATGDAVLEYSHAQYSRNIQCNGMVLNHENKIVEERLWIYRTKMATQPES